MKNEQQTQPFQWRDLIHSVGRALQRDAFDDRAEPECLIHRTEQAIELLRAELGLPKKDGTVQQ